MNSLLCFLFGLKFYNVHQGNYIKAYSICFCVYSGIFYLGMLAYIAVGIAEKHHLIFCKRAADFRVGKLALALNILQAIIAIPLFLLRAIKLFNFAIKHNFQLVVEQHQVPVMSQIVILIPFLIIESIFWGTHCDESRDDRISNPYLILADKAFVIVMPLSMVFSGITFAVE